MKKVLSLILPMVLGMTIICFSGCNIVGLNINSIPYEGISYEGIYYNENKSFGVRIDKEYFKYAYFDGSGVWGDYSITSKTDSEVELVFGNMYKLKQGSQTSEVAYRVHTGATIKKEKENIVLYLHFKLGGDTKLVKEESC